MRALWVFKMLGFTVGGVEEVFIANCAIERSSCGAATGAGAVGAGALDAWMPSLIAFTRVEADPSLSP